MFPMILKQPAPGRERQENQQLEVIFSYAVGSRPVRTTGDPVSKKNRQHMQQRTKILSTKKHSGAKHCGTCLPSSALALWGNGIQDTGDGSVGTGIYHPV